MNRSKNPRMVREQKLQYMIEQKILEMIGDPDYNLELRPEFKREILRRLRRRGKTISHQAVLRKFG